ncbi:hypothetical protein EXE25_11310 [Acinetobacter bouvetii]|uniref:Uncharacterized protein n=1 Tax=Acinetobacter bouvetii TaxID=202951 RepID=A0A4Q7AS10_9GAMM|nr:hypothetical protein [Acinetobacter bouvetii]RZG66093.1 hypothetical protein EXE25_11310 [Acinetobacter bouvetii]
MSLGAVYLWEPEIFTGNMPDINYSERTAYELYQKYRGTKSNGNALQLWIDYIVATVTAPQYSEFFSEKVQKWAIGLQQGVKDQAWAILEIENFDILAQGDALYRVFYEAVQASGIGFYEPYFSVWGVGNSQIPVGAVEGVLTSFLKPLTTDSQIFNLEKIEPPRNIKKAEELVRLWAAQHPYAKNLKLYIYNTGHDFISPRRNVEHPELAPDEGYRACLFIDQVEDIFYQLKMSFGKLTTPPMVSFKMDLTNHFIPQEQQNLLKEKLILILQSQNIRTYFLNKFGKNEIKYLLVDSWDERTYIRNYFNEFNSYVSFIFAHLGNGNLKTLQAWAYGDMPEDTIIQLSYKDKMMIYALSLDLNSLSDCYEAYKDECSKKEYEKQEYYDKALSDLEYNYSLYQDTIALIREAGTALPAYQKQT